MRLTDSHLPQKHEKQLAKLHREYERSPLQRGDILPWKGSSLYPSFLELPLPSSTTPHRAPIESLLSASAPCRSRNGERRLQLIEPLRVGNYSERSSQIWRCKVLGRENEATEGDVVLKLYYHNWDEYMGVGYTWRDGDSVAEDEAMAYEGLKPIQGTQAPICYGFFDFVVPGGFVIKGALLEDLTLISKSLIDESARMHPKKMSKLAYLEWSDNILTRICISIHHLHHCRVILHRTIRAEDTLIPMEVASTISSGNPYAEPLIFVGFVGARPFSNVPPSLAEEHCIKLNDCNQTLDILIRSKVFLDGTIRKWQYYARKDGHFLLDKGIIFDRGALSGNFVESGSDSEESEEDVSGEDDSEDDSDSGGDSD